jgi:hypothetical protein
MYQEEEAPILSVVGTRSYNLFRNNVVKTPMRLVIASVSSNWNFHNKVAVIEYFCRLFCRHHLGSLNFDASLPLRFEIHVHSITAGKISKSFTV